MNDIAWGLCGEFRGHFLAEDLGLHAVNRVSVGFDIQVPRGVKVHLVLLELFIREAKILCTVHFKCLQVVLEYSSTLFST